MLIDLDRSEDVSSKANDIRYRKGVMYNVPDEWTVSMIDFRQLGVLIYAASLSQPMVGSYHDLEIPQLRDKFVERLLKGKYH